MIGKKTSPPWAPSPKEIRTACRQIRREWSGVQKESRRITGRQAWRLLIYHCPKFGTAPFGTDD